MTTPLLKTVSRVTTGEYSDRSHKRKIVVSLCRGDVISFRFAGTSTESTVEIPVDLAYQHALVRHSGLSARDMKPQKRGL